jgi:hypothetical protein
VYLPGRLDPIVRCPPRDLALYVISTSTSAGLHAKGAAVGIDQYDVIAVILGVFFTVRKLDARSREHASFPTIEQANFEAWKKRAVLAYSIASYACFVRVLFHFAFVKVATTYAFSPKIYTRVGIVIDLAWLGSVAYGLFLARSARQLQRQYGIDLEKRPESPR